jgi:hypothetical protein
VCGNGRTSWPIALLATRSGTTSAGRLAWLNDYDQTTAASSEAGRKEVAIASSKEPLLPLMWA